MDRRRFVWWFSGICMLIVIGLVSTTAGAAEFSADMTLGEPEKTLHGKLYVRNEKYRMEVQENNKTIAVLVDEKAGFTRVLVPSKKIYLEMKNDDLRSAMNNPFVSYRISESQYKSQAIGKETVNGYACTKRLIKAQGKDFLTAWFSDKLGFPIKIVNHLSKGRFVELTNIQEGSQDGNLFEPPAGYAKMDRMPVEPPPWAGDVPKAPSLEAPFEETLSAGKIVRAPLREGYKIRIKGKSLSEGKAAFTAVAFKEGNPVKEPSMCTFNLSRKGQGMTVTPRESLADADEIVIRVREGSVLITAELEEAPEGIVLQKHFIKNMSGKELHAETDRPFRLVIRDDEKDGKDTRGKLTLYKGRAQHKQKAEEFDLNIKNGESRSWQIPADKGIGTLTFNVFDSGIHVRLEQPEKAGLVPPSWQKTAAKDTGPRKPEAQSVPPSRKATGTAEAQASEGPEREKPAAGDSSKSAPVAIMFILDASGSMWAQVEGRAKIEIAKEVMTELIQGLPDTAEAGLVAYGHRRKGDCQDVEELVPLRPIDKKALTDKIMAINPKGKTPITLSVRKTADKLKTVEEETIIILVSDGKETCEGDPCALVKELKEAGIRFTMHVIGLDVTEEERDQLECMAKAGGGEYFTAKTAQEFRVAAQKVVKESQNFGYLKVTALRSGTPIEAHMEVFPQGQKESITSGRTETAPKSPGAKLKPGTYDLLVVDRQTATKPEVRIDGITIDAGMTTTKEINFSAGALRLTVQKEGKPSFAWVYVNEAGTENRVASSDTSVDNPVTLHLLPGTYDVVVKDDKVSPPQEVVLSGITIEPGSIVEKTADFSEGFLSVTVRKEGKPSFAWIRVNEQGTENRVASSDTSVDNPVKLQLVPGIYDVVVTDDRVKPPQKVVFTQVTIEPGSTSERAADFSEGLLSVEVLVNGQKDSAGLYIYEAGTENRIATGDTSSDNPRIVKLVPGKYDLKVIYRKSKPEREMRFDGIEITAGQTTEKRAEFGEGLLSVEVMVNGQKGSAGLYIYQAGTDKRVTTGDTSSDNPRIFKLNPGAYDLKVAYRKAKPETEEVIQGIEIATGQKVEKRLEFQEGTLEVRAASGGKDLKSGLEFFNPGEKSRFATGNGGRKIPMRPGSYEVQVKAYTLPDKPVKRVSFTIQAGQSTVLNVDF